MRNEINMDRHPKNKGICSICEKEIKPDEEFTWADGSLRVYYHKECWWKRNYLDVNDLTKMIRVLKPLITCDSYKEKDFKTVELIFQAVDGDIVERYDAIGKLRQDGII